MPSRISEFECCGEVDLDQVIDLDVYQDEYTIGRESDSFKHSGCPWHKTIVCQGGHIGPSGGSMLLASSLNKRLSAVGSPTTKALRELALADPSRFKLIQDGDDGVNVEFDVEDLDEILEILPPK